MNKQRGFTLLEVLVSATIIAVLTTIGLVSFSSVNKRSRDVKRKSDLEQIRSALEMFRSDNTTYPGEYPQFAASKNAFANASGLSTELVSTYMPAIPSDPDTDNSYYYEAISTGGQYTSYCVCAHLETIPAGTTQSTCASIHASCNYGLKSP